MTPILIAAKRGVIEIVEEILKEFPVAIRDLDSKNKNVVLLAVESTQRDVCTFLFGSNRIVPESAFRQLDIKGNSILHLAAALRVFEEGDLIHIQQELEFFQVCIYAVLANFIDLAPVWRSLICFGFNLLSGGFQFCSRIGLHKLGGVDYMDYKDHGCWHMVVKFNWIPPIREGSRDRMLMVGGDPMGGLCVSRNVLARYFNLVPHILQKIK